MDKSHLSGATELVLQGKVLAGGIVIGQPLFVGVWDKVVPEAEIPARKIELEVERYRRAVSLSKKDLWALKAALDVQGGGIASDCIDVHINMLEDPLFTTWVEEKIRQLMRNSESVFFGVVSEYKQHFSRADEFFQQRFLDIQDVSSRVLRYLQGAPGKQMDMVGKRILFAKDFVPSQIAQLTLQSGCGACSQYSGVHTHSVLIARSKRVPFLSDIDIEHVCSLAPKTVIIDAEKGILILNPSAETMQYYLLLLEEQNVSFTSEAQQEAAVAYTVDGTPCSLLANIGDVSDAVTFHKVFQQVGLLRTEYLFLGNKSMPTVEEQKAMYNKIFSSLGRKWITVRLFDFGADKPPFGFSSKDMDCQLRGIRFLLKYVDVLQAQLEALLSLVSQYHFRLLLPFVTSAEEVVLFQKILHSVSMSKGLSCNMQVGSMLEVPGALFVGQQLSEVVDFFSLGTNDLAQYVLGVDRGTLGWNKFQYHTHPAVLSAIHMATQIAYKGNKPLSVCGEMATDELLVPVLLGMGITSFSGPPPLLHNVKKVIQKWSRQEAFELTKKALTFSTQESLFKFLTQVYDSKLGASLNL